MEERQNDQLIIRKLEGIEKTQREQLQGLRDLHMVLLGSAEGETPYGRVPMLEATSEKHDGRLARLEKWGLLGVGGLIVLSRFADYAVAWFRK